MNPAENSKDPGGRAPILAQGYHLILADFTFETFPDEMRNKFYSGQIFPGNKKPG